jgi:hypothetical protein
MSRQAKQDSQAPPYHLRRRHGNVSAIANHERTPLHFDLGAESTSSKVGFAGTIPDNYCALAKCMPASARRPRHTAKTSQTIVFRHDLD